MTPFGGAVTVLLMPFIVFRIGQGVWDVYVVWHMVQRWRAGRRVERELDCYGQRGTVAQEFAELIAARSA